MHPHSPCIKYELPPTAWPYSPRALAASGLVTWTRTSHGLAVTARCRSGPGRQTALEIRSHASSADGGPAAVGAGKSVCCTPKKGRCSFERRHLPSCWRCSTYCSDTILTHATTPFSFHSSCRLPLIFRRFFPKPARHSNIAKTFRGERTMPHCTQQVILYRAREHP